MKEMDILIVSYVFPPYPGIGGRRWAKMAKYLARHGYRVHVLTAKNPLKERSLWTSDVGQERIAVYSLPPCYPAVLLKRKLSFFDKLAYRFWTRRLRSRHKGSIYDRAIEWGDEMQKAAAVIIRENNIRNVIATGAPFRVMHYAVGLKKEFPSLNVIVDFRDPWTSGKSYGFAAMDSINKAAELKLEQETVAGADHVLSPAPEILDDLRARYGHDEKYVHLPHAFDMDDFNGQEQGSAFPADAITFAFTGTIYNGLDDRLKALAVMLEQLRRDHPEIYRRIKIDFYTADSQHAVLFARVADVVRFFAPLPPVTLFATLRRYRYALVLFTEMYKDYLSTKFWELFCLRIPVVYCGPEGQVAAFLREHDLGLAFTGNNPEQDIRALLSESTRREFRFNIDLDGSSCEAITRRLETLFVD